MAVHITIAGTSSGSGKTSFSIGLMALLKKREHNIVAFKAGPDYIDPMFHRYVIKGEAYNLPLFLLDDKTIQYLYWKRATPTGVNIIEGVMGYLDGHHINAIFGSTADLAMKVKSPVLLLVDASGMALTAAAVVKGLRDFHQPSPIKGVVFNNVNSQGHYELLKDAVWTHTGIKSYGYLKKNDTIQLKSRHLGLIQAQEIEDLDQIIHNMSSWVEETVDVSGILCDFNVEAVDECALEEYDLERLEQLKRAQRKRRIGIAKDDAFSFYYDENLELLKECGVELIPFSPMYDKALPDVEGLYIGGGYPEVFAKTLSDNQAFIKDLLQKLENGLPVYAECGGLMYLADKLLQLNGDAYGMVGFFDATSRMTTTLQHFGHVSASLHYEGKEIMFKGHEFHKSVFQPHTPIETILEVYKGNRSWKCGYSRKNVIATYVHNHFYSNVSFLEMLLQLWDKGK